MANPWNATFSLKEGPVLSGIISESEELSQRLQVEDFVWVDVPKKQELNDVVAPTRSDDVASDSAQDIPSIAPTVVKMVRFAVNETNDEEKVTENLYYDEYTDTNESDEEKKFDKLNKLEFKIESKKPSMPKSTYPMPQWLKRKEHGTTRTNTNKKQNSEKVNPLLPKINFDASTTAILERFIDNRYLGKYNELVRRGKNSFVFHAECHRRNCMTMPCNNAAKVYKLGSDEQNRAIFKRVQREFEHLTIVHNFKGFHMKLQPIRAWENVIVMSFIGFDKTIASSIQDFPPHNDRDTGMYLEIVNFIDRCYNELHLVHGRLCARNIRCWFDRPQVIGWGHSVKTDHPLAQTKLIKDCKFVTEFYAQRGVKVKTTEDLFKEITQCTKISSKLLEVPKNRDLYDQYDKNPNRKTPSPVKPNRNLRFR